MKKYIAYILLLTSIFSQDRKLAVSILDFIGEDVNPKLLRMCYQRLETSLIESNKFMVIEKGQRDEILKEQKFQASGICNDECVVEIGQLAGTRPMIWISQYLLECISIRSNQVSLDKPRRWCCLSNSLYPHTL